MLDVKFLKAQKTNFTFCIHDDTSANVQVEWTVWIISLWTREEFKELIRQGQMLEYAEYVGR